MIYIRSFRFKSVLSTFIFDHFTTLGPELLISGTAQNVMVTSQNLTIVTKLELNYMTTLEIKQCDSFEWCWKWAHGCYNKKLFFLSLEPSDLQEICGIILGRLFLLTVSIKTNFFNGVEHLQTILVNSKELHYDSTLHAKRSYKQCLMHNDLLYVTFEITSCHHFHFVHGLSMLL